MSGLQIAALEQEVASRPTQVKLDELSRTVAEGVKALEEEIVKVRPGRRAWLSVVRERDVHEHK